MLTLISDTFFVKKHGIVFISYYSIIFLPVRDKNCYMPMEVRALASTNILSLGKNILLTLYSISAITLLEISVKKKQIKLFRNFLVLTGTMLFASQVALADTPCTSALIIPQVPLFFYAHSLGSYDISLADTLNAIETGRAGGALPYEKKVWTGSCPAGLDSGVGDCIEFTVYPNFAKYPQTNDNFTNGPVPIMQKIEQYNNNHPNRGEVRVITDASEQNYVYTADHEVSFCGPYPLPKQ